ncbi:MAG: hypothetical protein ACKOU6_13605 [Planctomycetota bacterium]
MRLSSVFAALVGLLVSLASLASVQAQFEEMINRVPRDANAMVLVNGDKVFASPVAKRENWQANRQKMFEAGLAFLPPNAESGILASHLDFEFMLPTWELALFHSHQNVTAEMIQKKIGGKVEKILNQPAVDAPGDAYIVVLGPQLVSLFTPQNRQVTTRWLRDYLGAKTASVSPYLQEAYGFAQEHGTPVILAIDLEGTVSVETAQKAIARSKTVADDKSADIEAMANVIGGLRGVMLGITFNERAYGKIRVDFADSAAPLAKYGKAFLLHALGNHGAAIDDFQNWEAKIDGKMLTLEGPLSPSGIMRLSTLFQQPMAIARGKADGDTPPMPQDKESLTREASLTYYKGVNKLIRDLDADARDLKTMGQYALWMDRYATRIDNLPVVNVDEDLVKFGSYAANTLRNASGTVRNGLAQGDIASANTPTVYNNFSYGETYGYGYRAGLLGGGYVPYGYYNSVDVIDQRATMAAQSRNRSLAENQGTRDARKILQDLNASMGQIRQQMSQKYGVEFSGK